MSLPPTNAEIAYQMSGLMDRWTLYTTQLRDWLGGTADGGPNGDGAYPLQDVTGQTFLVPCPAAWSAKVTDLTDPLEGVQATVDAGVAAAQAAQAAAEQAQAIAQTYRDATQAASGDASMYATNAANSATDARTSKDAAATSETNAAASAEAAATSETNAANSATAAAASATDADNDAIAAAQSAQAAAESATQAAQSASGKLAWYGVWNITQGTLPADPPAPGFYWISGTATIDGETYKDGDGLVWGTEGVWHHIDNNQTVASVAGLVGTITVGQLQQALMLSAVATSGNYNDLSNKPILSTVATSGSYTDLSNKPVLFSGSYNDLTNKPSFALVATSGSYNDLSNKPTLGPAASQGYSASNTANTLVQRNGSGDIVCRLVRGEYQDESSMSGALVFRINNNTNNYLRACNSPSSVRSWLGLGSAATESSGSFMLNGNSTAGSLNANFQSGVYRFSGSTTGTPDGSGNYDGVMLNLNVSGQTMQFACGLSTLWWRTDDTGDGTTDTGWNQIAMNVYVQSSDPGNVPDGSLWVW